jgi:hypothetical protein
MKAFYTKYILFFFIILTSISFAQTITWSEVTSSYSLPAGVKVFKGTRTSPALIAYYLDVDLNKQNLAIKPYLTPAGSELINNFVTRYGAIAGVNGGYFGGTTSYSAVIQPGNVLAKNIASVTRTAGTYYTMRSLFSATETRDLAVNWVYHFGTTVKDVYTYSAPLANTETTPAAYPTTAAGTQFQDLFMGVGGGPTLVKNGVAHITYTEEVMFGSGVSLDTQDPRTAVGYTKDKHVIILAADGRQTTSLGLTLTELAQVFINLGCVEAMNLDGGGSTQMAIGNTIIDSPSESRAIVSMLAVVNNDSLGFLPPVYYKKIIDTEDTTACKQVGGWTASANTGYYGTSPCIYSYIGDGSKYVSYKPSLPKAGSYDVFGWWVSAGNRAKDTPFIVTRKGGVDTVRIDQTVNSSKWNKIGTFTFSGTANDEIRISNAATTGTLVVADAIRILSYDSTLTEVKTVADNKIVSGYKLNQNYPNPFNNSTVIKYVLPSDSFVSMKVYNILGNEVMTLCSETQKSGQHIVMFDGKDLPSGIYFYQLQAGKYSETKKFCFLK